MNDEATTKRSSKPLLDVRDLTVTFDSGKHAALVVENLSFAIDEAQTLAIVGESGSGKSVTALAILGLVSHMGGRLLNGNIDFHSDVLASMANTEPAPANSGPRAGAIDLRHLSEEQLGQVRGNEIALISQEPMTALNPVFTIGSQLTETLRLHRDLTSSEARAEAIALLGKVRLPGARRLLDRYPHQLSGGMRQRVMIALALSCHPKLLIADEPTTALDVTIQAEILHIIRELQEETGTALLFISHDMAVVSEMADDVLVMRYGKRVEYGTASDVLLLPDALYTQQLLAAVPRIGSMRGEAQPLPFKGFDVSHEQQVEERPQEPPSAPMAQHDSTSITAALADTPVPSAKSRNTDMLLKLDGVTTRYDIRGGFFNRVTHQAFAVEQVSLHIRPGETLSLVGESGSGKSTLGKTIQQLVKARAGSLYFDGQSVFDGNADVRHRCLREISYIFQDPYGSLNPRKSVGVSIAEPIITHGLLHGKQAIQQRVGKLLLRVGLKPSQANRYPHQFSGGQRQRLCIARALASEPRLIIADEAVSALDVLIQAQVINLLLDLQREEGLSFLFISHDMAVVERISHRVAVMYLGQLVEMGTRQQVFENPQHPYTRKLLQAVPVVKPGFRPSRQVLGVDIPSPVRRVGDAPKPHTLFEHTPGHQVAAHDSQ